MKIQSSITKFFLLSTLFISLSLISLSQIPTAQALPDANFTDEELKQFANAVSKVMVIQEEGQLRMVTTIQGNELTLERFNEMVTEAQEKGPENIDASDKEITAFNKSLSEVQVLQMQLQEQMLEAIAHEGLDIDQYQKIMQAYESDSEVKEKIDSYFAEYEE
jgi:hypothetical protein